MDDGEMDDHEGDWEREPVRALTGVDVGVSLGGIAAWTIKWSMDEIATNQTPGAAKPLGGDEVLPTVALDSAVVALLADLLIAQVQADPR